jgi:TolB-like protein
MERQELLTQVWKGMFVTDDSLVQAIGDIRRAIDDQGHQMIRTVPRRGYRLMEHLPDQPANPEMPAAAPAVGHPLPALPAPQAAPAVERRRAEVATQAPAVKLRMGFASILLMGALLYLGWYLQTVARPPRLSIVVLPFVNASGDPTKDYIADSITEDITVQLSRVRGSFVIGRGTAFTCKDKAVDLKALAKDLNVRYVLQGTAGRSDAGYRITAQLIDGSTGVNLWADALEAALDHPTDIREWVADQLSNALKLHLIHAEASQSARRIHPDSVVMDMLCHAHMHLAKFQDAIDWCNKSYALNMGDYWALTDQVAAYTATGDFEKTARAKDKLLKLNPKFTMGFYKGRNISNNPVWPKEVEENVWSYLRKAGVPE